MRPVGADRNPVALLAVTGPLLEQQRSDVVDDNVGLQVRKRIDLPHLTTAIDEKYLEHVVQGPSGSAERIGLLVLGDVQQVEAAALGEVAAVDVVVLDLAKLLGEVDRCGPRPLQALEISVSHGRVDINRSD